MPLDKERTVDIVRRMCPNVSDTELNKVRLQVEFLLYDCLPNDIKKELDDAIGDFLGIRKKQ